MRRGFSLLELMIVVAIIGILAALAIPQYRQMQYKAKRTELPANVDGIRVAALSYLWSHDVVLSCPPAPRYRSDMNKEAVVWSPMAVDTSWNELGWSPDGDVRGVYELIPNTELGFLAFGASDLDDDNNEAHYYASRDNTVYTDTPDFIF